MSTAWMPGSISSTVAVKSTVLPTMIGTPVICRTSSSSCRPLSERDMWRAVVTVEATTK